MALVTIAQVKQELPGLATGGTGKDTELTALVAKLGEQFALELLYEPVTEGGVATLEQVTYTKFQEGPGGRRLFLEFYPLGTITSIEDDPNEDFDGSAFLVDSGDYDATRPYGEVLLTINSTHGFWTRSGERVIKAIYQGGWATVPDTIQQAAIDEVAHRYNLLGTRGRTNVTAGGDSVTPLSGKLLEETKEKIAHFKLLRGYE